MDLPAGYQPLGAIRLYCDAEPTTLGIYDESHTLISEASVSGGIASLTFDSLNLDPGHYFIRVLTSNSTQPAPYVLELAGELINIQPTSPVEVTPPTLYVDPNRVFKHGNYLYMIGYGVWVYDVSDPTDPIQVYHDWTSTTRTACFYYPYLYYVQQLGITESQVNMIDFTDPANPVLHEDIVHFPSCQLAGICMNSTHLYAGTMVQPTSEVLIYEFASSPTSPTHVGTVASIPYDPQLLDLMDPEGPDTILVVGTWNDILTYEVENPASPTPAGSYNFPVGCPRDITTQGSCIYVAYDKTAGGEGWLYVLYQSSLPDLLYLGSLDLPGHALEVAVDPPYAYFADGSAGLTICNVNDPSNPAIVTSTSLLSYGIGLAQDGEYVYIIPEDAGLQIVDVSIPIAPVLVTHLKVLNAAYSFAVKDNYLMVAEVGYNDYGAIKTVDISDPPHAMVVGEEYPLDRPWFISFNNDLLLAAFQHQWILYDASDPTDLQQLAAESESDQVTKAFIWNNAAYVNTVTTDQYLKVYDISSPSSPSYKNTITLSDLPYDIVFSGNYMYIVTSLSVEIYSLTNPFMPNNVGSYSNTVYGYHSGEIKGKYLYLCSADSLEITDISNPTSPVYVGSELFPVVGSDYYYYLAVDNQIGYMSGYVAKSYSCLLWPSDDPTLIGPVYEGYAHGTRDLLARDGYLYEATESTGIHIFDLY
jgi:hypothetical protein